MKAERIKNQTIEIDGLWRRGVFQKVLRSSITLQDRVRRKFSASLQGPAGFFFTSSLTGGQMRGRRMR